MSTISSSSSTSSDAERKRFKKPLTRRTIRRKLHELKIEKNKLKKEKKDAIADIEKHKKILIDMGFSNFVESFEEIERLCDDKDPRIQDFTINFIEDLNSIIN